MVPYEVRRSPNVISQGNRDRDVQKAVVQEYWLDGSLDTDGGVKKKTIDGWIRCGMS